MSKIAQYRRFAAWDYSRGASLFISIATSPRRALLGKVSGGKVVLSRFGKIVDEALLAIPKLNPGILLFKRVVMPDHVHFSVCIKPGLDEPLKLLGKAIGRFKNFTTKQAKALGLIGHSPIITDAASRADAASGRILWQQGYHDWLCPTREKIEATDRYIAYNPLKWQLMYGLPGYLRIKEPLSSPRLDCADYWKGVGNVSLLGEELNLVALRVSMKVRDFAPVVRRLESAVGKGWVVISGFISKGEREVLKMLLARKDARFIRIRPSCIPNARFKPESALVEAFAQNRYLEIAKGNEEIEFSRSSCLGLNEEIVKIATSAGGVALHWREDGPRFSHRRPAIGPDGRAMPGQSQMEVLQ